MRSLQRKKKKKPAHVFPYTDASLCTLYKYILNVRVRTWGQEGRADGGAAAATSSAAPSPPAGSAGAVNAAVDAAAELALEVVRNFVRVGPLYSLAALAPGVYVMGMKDQFNVHDLKTHPLAPHVEYIADESGFVLYDRAGGGCSAASVGRFGIYGLEQYLLMEVLSRHEVASNVLEYYLHHREKLERSLDFYNEAQGQGFVCWRFLMKRAMA